MDASSEVCSKCGGDVRNVRRFKDAKGRLVCAPCADQIRAKAQECLLTASGVPSHMEPAFASAPSSPPEATPDSSAPAPAVILAPVPEPLEDGTIALAEEVAARDEQAFQRPQQTATGGSGIRDLELCPDCGAPWGSSVICTGCGYNRTTGEHLGQNVPPPAGTDPDLPPPPKPPKPCAKCGYDLNGLKTARCPECGMINSRLKRGELSAQETLRRMYLVPLMLTGIGLSITILIKFVYGMIFGGVFATSPFGAAGEAVLTYLILFPLTLAVGFVVYIVCSMMFLGFDEPLGVTFVRLAAVYALTDIAQALIRPLPMFAWVSGTFIVVGIVYVGLLMQFMELDLEDAWIVAVITFFVKLFVALGALWIYANYF